MDSSSSRGSNRIPVVSVTSGTSVSTHPARSETSSGSPHAAASLTTSPQGSIRLGCTNADANAYQRDNSSAWRNPGRWIASGHAARGDRGLDLGRAGAVAAEDQVPGRPSPSAEARR